MGIIPVDIRLGQAHNRAGRAGEAALLLRDNLVILTGAVVLSLAAPFWVLMGVVAALPCGEDELMCFADATLAVALFVLGGVLGSLALVVWFYLFNRIRARRAETGSYRAARRRRAKRHRD